MLMIITRVIAVFSHDDVGIGDLFLQRFPDKRAGEVVFHIDSFYVENGATVVVAYLGELYSGSEKVRFFLSDRQLYSA